MTDASARMEITLRDVYEAQQQTNTQVGGLVTQLAQFTASVGARLDSGQRTFAEHKERLRAVEQAPKADPAQMADHENRIRSLEKWKYGLPLASLLALASTIAAVAALLKR